MKENLKEENAEIKQNLNKNLFQKVDFIIQELNKKYPEAECGLKYEGEAYKLLILARLSAQCTDLRVNLVAKNLFAKYKSLKYFAECDLNELEKDIFSCGLYKTKAKNIKSMCNILYYTLNSKVPEDMETLLKLPGVGRKIANLIRGDVFNKPAIVADTHCIRIANKLGLCLNLSPAKVENELKNIIPEEQSNNFCHRLVLFGREICSAKLPKCDVCFLQKVCDYYENLNKN